MFSLDQLWVTAAGSQPGLGGSVTGLRPCFHQKGHAPGSSLPGHLRTTTGGCGPRGLSAAATVRKDHAYLLLIDHLGLVR